MPLGVGSVCLVLKGSCFHPGPSNAASSAACGKRAGCGDLLPTCILHAPRASRPEEPQAQKPSVTRAPCPSVTPPPLPWPSPQPPGPWEDLLTPPLPHSTAAPTAAPTPAVEKPDTKVPEVCGEGPRATQSSGSLCTLSSTCGIFEHDLGHLSWG